MPAHTYSVMDVGVGCGIIAAAAAFMVGPTGRVVGIDVRQVSNQMNRDGCAHACCK